MPEPDRYVATSAVPVSVDDAFAYHDRPGALDRLIPPWESVHVERSDQSLQPGSQVALVQRMLGIRLRWLAEHTEYDPPNLFVDTQLKGPFQYWEHRHEFEPRGEEQCLIRDNVAYRVPMGSLGKFFGGGLVRRKLESMFAFRHRVVNDDLDLWQKYSKARLRIGVSGSNGLMGRQLVSMLQLFGHEVTPLLRNGSKATDGIRAWSDEQSEFGRLSELDVVIHLAGKPIAEKRWDSKVKAEIRDSRVGPTEQLCVRLAQLEKRPSTLICASATGYYGNRGEVELTERDEPGTGFLPEVCVEWEKAADAACGAGIRVVHARFGVVLTPRGGALQKCLFPAKMMGGKLGSGKQWWSWIALDDAIGALYHCMQDTSIQGAVNLVSPEPTQNREFASILGRVLGRPALIPAPAFMLRLALGEMADGLLLDSVRAMPQRLIDTGYQFRFPTLQECLRNCLGYDRLESLE